MMVTRAERLQLIGILAIAATLRMAFPGITEFKADEARLYSLAYDLASGEHFPWHSIGASIGIPNFPLGAWLYALPLSLWRHPYAPTLFTGLLNTIAVLACWSFARRYWGASTGILAAFFFAVSPWAIVFSRKIWAQNLLPIFVLGWAITAVMTFFGRRRRPALFHGFLLGCIPQIHFSGLALMTVSAVTGLICYRRVAWRWLFSGLAIALAAAAPLAFHFFSHGLPSLPDPPTTSPVSFRTDSLVFTWLLSTGTDIHALAGNPGYRDFRQTAPDMAPVHWLWGGLIAIGCWRMLLTQHSRERFRAQFVIAWLLAPALLLLWSPVPVYPHYFIITFPAQYIAAALGGTTLLERLSHPLHRATGWAILLASGGLQIWMVIALFQFIAFRATPGGYGSPLAIKLEAADSARSAVHSSSAIEVIIVGNGNDPAVHQFPAVYDALLRETPHRFVDGNASALRTASPTVVLLQTGQQPAQMRYLEWSTHVTSIPMRIGERALKVLKLPPLTTEIIPERVFSPPSTLANGVILLGFQPTSLQDELRWELHWRAGDASSTKYHFFNHLLDDTGKRVGQADLPAFAAHQWRPGDRIISFFSAPLDNPPETLRVGMYTYPDIANVPVVDWSGNILRQAVIAEWDFP